MSEDHNAGESDETSGITDSINRRRFVKSLSAAGVASVGISGMATASAEDGTIHVGDRTIDMISGRESNRVAANAQAAESFKELRQYLRHEHNYSVDTSDETVAKVNPPNGDNYTLVSFELVDSHTNSTIPPERASIAVILQNDADVRTKGVIIHDQDNKSKSVPQTTLQKETTTTTEENGEIHRRLAQLPSRDFSVEELSTMEFSSEDPQFTTQSTPASCSQCKFIAKHIQGLECGIGMAFVCGAAGFPTAGIGTALCAAVAYAICTNVPNKNPAAACQIIGDC